MDIDMYRSAMGDGGKLLFSNLATGIDNLERDEVIVIAFHGTILIVIKISPGLTLSRSNSAYNLTQLARESLPAGQLDKAALAAEPLRIRQFSSQPLLVRAAAGIAS